MKGHGIRFNINPKLYIKDPQGTNYGQKLLQHGVLLLDQLGFEAFTFRKLAREISSTEASVYRYFENKHMLLLYLTCWYWEWVYYLIDMNTRNISDPQRLLEIIIHNLVNASTESPVTEYINERTLHEVIIKEGSKAYHIHNVDAENRDGFFQGYKELVNRIASAIRQVSPKFKYPKILASNLFEMASNQIYFADHLPALTDIKNQKTKYADLEQAMLYMTQRLLV